ncbi:hypothetical protein BOVA604_197 [Bacteroides ovatus]|jgi:hypothetical protein|uniref:O-antigen ligase family protein n=1 Tax=Bacteroides TaxID=816 RepID=UPI000E976FFA|nr:MULTISPECIES: O-antigen ligase family protein [Bacteroides]MCS3177399.1 O-antigen ligase family protein [Candidatus Bacteroides intestinigallinarum]RGN60781.1 O-antigen ligase domain-containing protein [Bacteroides sp. OM05-10AA]RGQ65181.1 O-antigen ligase domain-containing protein [Bacteroides sp. AF27-33]CAG9888850.1 hypothetical protein BOVA604_197 [Bacteroides ovatus]
MSTVLLSSKKHYFLLYLIILLIGFQQFPVLRIGGSFKIYELLSLILLLKYRNHGFWNSKLIALWVLFVFSPIISFCYSFFFLDIPPDFYLRYPEAKESFKFGNSFFAVLQIVYMLFCFAALAGVYRERNLYKYFNHLRKYIVIIGTCIAVYSLFALFIYDPILDLPSFLQHKSEYDFRSSGLSQEPGNYVVYQVWVVLFTYYAKNLFSKNTWLFMLIINILSLFFTFSTSLIAFVALVLLSYFLCSTTKKQKIIIVFLSLILFGVGYFILLESGYYDLFETLFLNKAVNFFSAADHTLDSGGFRNYTGRIGWEIFCSQPLFGVGVGNSVYYMHLYEFKMGIVSFGEMLSLGIFPQNLYACVFAEQGLLGGIALLLFLLGVVKELWKYRNDKPFGRMFFIGGLFNVAVALSNSLVYALYMWVFLVLALGYNKYVHEKNSDC